MVKVVLVKRHIPAVPLGQCALFFKGQRKRKRLGSCRTVIVVVATVVKTLRVAHSVHKHFGGARGRAKVEIRCSRVNRAITAEHAIVIALGDIARRIADPVADVTVGASASTGSLFKDEVVIGRDRAR
jgi:hypothetical protein